MCVYLCACGAGGKVKPNFKTVQTYLAKQHMPFQRTSILFHSILFYAMCRGDSKMILSNLFYSSAEVFIILKSAEQCRD